MREATCRLCGGERPRGRVRRAALDRVACVVCTATCGRVSIASSLTLEEQETVAPPALVSLAVKFGRTRLIDNVVLE